MLGRCLGAVTIVFPLLFAIIFFGVQVSLEVLHIGDLTVIPGTLESFAIDGAEALDLNMYFDDRYRNMNPIHCFAIDGASDYHDEACLVKLDNVYALPVFNHFGEYEFVTGQYSGDFPIKCDW